VRVLRSIGLLLPALLGATLPATAQQRPRAAAADSTASAPAAQAAPSPVQPIAPGSIADEAEQALALVVEAMTAVRGRPEVTAIIDEIPLLLDTLEQEQGVRQLQSQRLLTRRGLADLNLRWAARDTDVRQWQRTLTEHGTAVDSVRARLERELERWRLTGMVESDAGALPEVIARTEEIVAGLARVDSIVARHADAVLDAELRLNRIRTTIFGEQLALVSAQAQARRELLKLDSRPLWSAPWQDSTLTTASLGGLRQSVQAVEWFAQGHAGRLLAHLLLTALVALLALGSRHHLRQTGEHAVAASAEHYTVLRRPVAAVALVSLALVLWIYPRAPLIIYDVALLLAAVPLLLLLPELVPPDLLRASRAAIGFLVVQRVATIASLGTPPFRLVQFILSVAGVAMLGHGLRAGGVLRLETTRWRRLIGKVAWGLLAAFVLAALANLVGNVSLADALNAGVATSLFIGIVLRAVAQVVDVFVSEAIRRGKPHSRYLAERGEQLDRVLVGLVNLSAGLGWLVVTLNGFYLWMPLAEAARGLLGASFSIGAASISIGRILTFLLVVWLGTLVARLVSGLLELDVLGRMNLRRGMAVTVGSLVRYALISGAFFWAMAAVGVELSDLAIIGGAVGLGIGLGLQNFVNNFVSGMMLAFERPVSVGDTVQVGAHSGEIREIGIRASIIRTFEGAEVIVPNSDLITKDVVNWTRTGTRRRVEVLVGTAYGTDPAKVLQILLSVAEQHPEIRAIPKPIALFTGFGDSALTFALRAWTDSADWPVVRSDLAVAINAQLAAAGIEIPFPQRDLHLRSVAPEALQALARSESATT
jgi:small-conductance mechanosensitive channel